MSIPVLLLAVLMGGCSDADKGSGNPGDPLTPPTVTAVTPPDVSSPVCPNSAVITATFSKAMNPATINGSTFTVTSSGGTNVSGLVNYVAATNTATFTPSGGLAASSTFTATITNKVVDMYGNTLEANKTWSFATSPSCLPTVTSVTPPDGSTLVCPNIGVITATFSKAMNPATINASTFTVTSSGGTSVPGLVNYVGATNIATFTPTPSGSLAPSETFTATISNKVADTLGNTLAADKVWTFTNSPSCVPPPPTVTFVTPPDGSALVCPTSSPLITATFDNAMDAATINTATFTLTASGGASVPGLVSYAAATKIASFIPSGSLAPSTTFAATITSAVADTLGNTLAANKTWAFTTPATCLPPPPPVNSGLGAACSFGILAASTVTNVDGTVTTVGGDVGVWPLTAITGFGPPAVITGAQHAGDAVAQTAQGDLTVAYNNAAAAPGGAVLPADIGGETLPAGVYRTTSAQPSLGITGNLTLDGGGDPNAVFIFQIVSTLTTATGNSQVLLIGNAQAKNVFWQVGSSATLGTNTMFTGTIMAQASITLTTGATLNGRALARTAAVTMDTNTVVVPPCP